MIDVVKHGNVFDEKNLVGSDLLRAQHVEVETVTIDDVLLDLGLLPPVQPVDSEIGQNAPQYPPISVLKLDCEGCEPGALLGAERMFRYNPPQYIITEVRSGRLTWPGLISI